jgi:hypothetical protein
MDNVLESYERDKNVRPTFLTVLCILTFLCSGYFLIVDTVALLNPQAQADKVLAEANKPTTETDPQAIEIQRKVKESMIEMFTAENIRNRAIGGVASDLLCLIGALMMWFLRRTGYFIYILGTILGIAIPIALFGASNLIALGFSIFVGFFGLLFIVLYGLNLKSMR